VEYLDIVDENGRPTGDIVERGKAHAEGIRHRTAHVWLLRRKNGRMQILLQKRSVVKDSYPGCYDISSAGHIPAGVGFEESALRELREELGVTAEPAELIPCGARLLSTDDVFHGNPFHERQYSKVFALWHDAEESDFTLQKEEVESVLWMDFDECIAAVRGNTIKHCVFPGELDMIRKAVQDMA